MIMMSISNNEIKRIKALHQKKFRDESGLFIVEGEKLVEEAQKSRFKIHDIYRRDVIGEDSMKTAAMAVSMIRKAGFIYILLQIYLNLSVSQNFGQKILYL